jgi:hypothetical protein
MDNNIPPRRIKPAHLRALIDLTESDAFVCDVTGNDDEDLAGFAVMVAARRWACEYGPLLESETEGDKLIEAILEIARDVGELLAIPAVRSSLPAESLRAMQRVGILTLDNLGVFQPRPKLEEEPF